MVVVVVGGSPQLTGTVARGRGSCEVRERKEKRGCVCVCCMFAWLEDSKKYFVEILSSQNIFFAN